MSPPPPCPDLDLFEAAPVDDESALVGAMERVTVGAIERRDGGAPRHQSSVAGADGAAQLAAQRRETSNTENRVRETLRSQQARVRHESQRLAVIDTELRKLNAQEARDVGILRSTLEEVDRELVWLQRDFLSKQTAFEKAKDSLQTASARKRTMHEHLALMVLSSEKRKEEKLNQLLAQMGGDDECPGACA